VHALSADDADAITAARTAGEFVWVDLLEPSPEELARVGDLFDLHPLAIEDATEFDQLPKIDHYRDWMLLVFYGVAQDAGDVVDLIETHLFVSNDWLITVRREPCLSLEELRHEEDPGDERWIVYRVIDALTDSFFSVLHTLDGRIEALENEILEGDVHRVREHIVALRRSVGRLSRVLITQRDILDGSAKDLAGLAGLGHDSSAYFRDVQDHLRRLALRADGQRDRLTGAIHLADSTINTRMTRASERLALIATIFLPLTAVASFFGMNFSWMIDHIGSGWWFLGLGIVFPAATIIGLFVYVAKRGYLD